jgi:GntR family transcriptional regulator
VQILTIDTRTPTPIYLQIIEQVRDGVQSGDLTPGTPLPSVRQLASELEINPNTVAKAYLLLEREGILRSVRRRGCFVAEGAAARAEQSLGQRLDQALDRVIEETVKLGVSRAQLLDALQQKIGGRHTLPPHSTNDSAIREKASQRKEGARTNRQKGGPQ